MTSRPAAPESETMVQLINAQFEECCDVGGHWDRMRDIALEVAATLLGELNFTYQRAEQAEKRCDLAQTEIKGHMRTEDDLRRDLASEVAIVNRVWKALGIETYDAAKPFAIDEHVTRLKVRIAELEAEIERLNYAQRLFVK